MKKVFTLNSLKKTLIKNFINKTKINPAKSIISINQKNNFKEETNFKLIDENQPIKIKVSKQTSCSFCN